MYEENDNNIKDLPKDEEKLVELKVLIAEINVSLAKMEAEVNRVYDFLIIMEDYCYEYDFGEI